MDAESPIPHLDIVVPCFNEAEVLPETASRLVALLDALAAGQRIAQGSRIVFVDDGSQDRTWHLIEELARANSRISGIKLSHNRGHQNALLAGLFTVTGEIVVSVDADLQDDIQVIPQMLESYGQGADVVFGVRNDRTRDSFFKRATARLFYRLMRTLGAESIPNHADFRLMSRRAVQALQNFREVNLFLRGIVPLIGFKSSIVYYRRSERFAGVSKYPLKRMIALALEAITSFSIVPLRLITLTGFLVFAFSCLMALRTFWIRLFTTAAVPGWASMLLPIYFLGGVQIMCLGILGEYLGKVYQETKARPRYIIEKTV